MKRRAPKLPPIVRCSRCCEVIQEAKPTRSKKVVCLRCLRAKRKLAREVEA